MRLAVAAALLVLYSNVHTLAQTATIDPTIDPPKVSTAKAPAPQNVNVVNTPDVNVANLPLDADGAVRVTSAPARQMVWYELLPAPLDVPGNATVTIPAIVNTDGFSTVGVGPELSAFNVSLQTRWVADEAFSAVADARIGVNAFGAQACGSLGASRLVCHATGGDVQVVLSNRSGGTNTVTSVRVYLFP